MTKGVGVERCDENVPSPALAVLAPTGRADANGSSSKQLQPVVARDDHTGIDPAQYELTVLREESAAAALEEFRKDAIEGFSKHPKYISSRYFYDDAGSELFAKITDLEEYYPTMTEYGILERNAQQIVQQICGNGTHRSETSQTFNLVELGAGDGRKTKVLLRAFLAAGVSFEYMPIDISRQAMELLFSSMSTEFGNEAKLHGFVGDSVESLDYIARNWPERRIITLFLGSSIGNYCREDAFDFLSAIRSSLKPGDMLFAGLDLKKDPEILRRAYSDSHGATKAFNLNLLVRMRRELAATLDERDFDHLALYNPVRGAMESYLISKKEQIVEIAGQSFHFDEAEPLHTELSHKYLLKEVDFMMKKAGFVLVSNFVDDRHWFVDTLVQVRH